MNTNTGVRLALIEDVKYFRNGDIWLDLETGLPVRAEFKTENNFADGIENTTYAIELLDDTQAPGE